MARGEDLAKLTVAIAMNSLCEESDYGDITVKEICAKAGVSHTQFYRLFKSKYDIAPWYYRFAWAFSLGEIGRSLTWKEGIELAGEEPTSLPALRRSVLGSEVADEMRESLRQIMRDYLLDTVGNYKGVEVTDRLMYQIEFYTRAATQIELWWQYEMASSEDLAVWHALCVPDDLYTLLNSPDKPRQQATNNLLTMILGASLGR